MEERRRRYGAFADELGPGPGGLGQSPGGPSPRGIHGAARPPSPLGTDWLTAQEIARRASARGGWLVLPTLPVGVSEHHRQFWGTLWVPPEVLRDYVMGVARALASHGLRKLVLVNGHGGNTAALEEAARRLRQERIYTFVYVWWRAIPEVIAQVIEGSGSHAGSWRRR